MLPSVPLPRLPAPHFPGYCRCLLCLGLVAPPRRPPAWLDSAVLFGVSPCLLAPRQGFRAALQRLPEWADLGVDALWLQPVFRTHGGGQGYDVTDFFRLRPDYGDESDFRDLVRGAHALGMRVLLDLPINHVSEHHPWYRDLCESGAQSSYSRHFQSAGAQRAPAPFAAAPSGRGTGRTPVPLSDPYAVHYRINRHGHVGYFWEDLVNLDFDNPEVRRMITDAAAYWIRRFDVDGYRIDAAWAIAARRPDFLPGLGRALRALKPGVVLIAEDKASRKGIFEEGCDAAYDWESGEKWVSQWSWQTRWHASRNHTVFNAPRGSRGAALRRALSNGPGSRPPRGKVVRFLENNDTPRFISDHGPERTRMAAALLFALPGLPLLFNGQEIGLRVHPYRSGPLYDPDRPIADGDRAGLFPLYRGLIRLRKTEPALRSPDFEEIPVQGSGDLFAFLRPHPHRPAVCLFNLGAEAVEARFAFASAGAWEAWDVPAAVSLPVLPERKDGGWGLVLEPFAARILFPRTS